MVYGLERAAQQWAGTGNPRMSVGDISLQNGGKISGHVSHQRGVDADVRPVRNDGREAPVTIHQGAYSRTRTAKLQTLIRGQMHVILLLFNDGAIPGTRHWPNHDNHFHVRIGG
jgi:murein endopeptidase